MYLIKHTSWLIKYMMPSWLDLNSRDLHVHEMLIEDVRVLANIVLVFKKKYCHCELTAFFKWRTNWNWYWIPHLFCKKQLALAISYSPDLSAWLLNRLTEMQFPYLSFLLTTFFSSSEKLKLAGGGWSAQSFSGTAAGLSPIGPREAESFV